MIKRMNKKGGLGILLMLIFLLFAWFLGFIIIDTMNFALDDMLNKSIESFETTGHNTSEWVDMSTFQGTITNFKRITFWIVTGAITLMIFAYAYNMKATGYYK